MSDSLSQSGKWHSRQTQNCVQKRQNMQIISQKINQMTNNFSEE